MEEFEKEARPHWSYTAISEYMQCPMKFFFHRIEQREAERISLNLVLGKALHLVYSQVMALIYPRMTEPVNSQDIERLFVQEFVALQEDKIDYDGSSYEEVLEKGKVYSGMVTDYLIKKKFDGKEVWIERPFMVPLISEEKIFEMPLVGIFDVVEIDYQNKKATVIDFKTSATRYSEWKLSQNLQGIIYTYGLSQMLGNEYTIAVQFAVLLKHKTPSIVEYDCVCSEKDLKALPKTIDSVEKCLKVKAFYPNPSMIQCPNCEYYNACRD